MILGLIKFVTQVKRERDARIARLRRDKQKFRGHEGAQPPSGYYLGAPCKNRKLFA